MVLLQQPVSISLIGILILKFLSADMLIFLTRVESTQIKELYSIFTLVFAMIPQDLGSC